MKMIKTQRTFLIVLLTTMALHMTGSEPPVSLMQLKHDLVSPNSTSFKPMVSRGESLAAAVQQSVRERNKASDVPTMFNWPGHHNEVNSKLLGDRIIVADAYDFDWDDQSGTALIDFNSHMVLGKKITIGISYKGFHISGFFGEYFSGCDAYADIPIEFNDDTTTMSFKTNVQLAAGSWAVDPGLYLTSHSKSLNDSGEGTILELTRSAYLMPESWLMGDDEFGDSISGKIYEDGSILIEEGFVILFQDVVTREGLQVDTLWGLSPIYHNMSMMMPNGTHRCLKLTSKDDNIPHYDHNGLEKGLGIGGLIPAPIDPRPSNPKPVNPRPTPPRPTNQNLTNHYSQSGNDALNSRSLRALNTDSLISDFGIECHNETYPVFMYQVDTTLYVYNLFDNDYCWNYINILDDGRVKMPAQVVDCHGADYNQFIYNCSLANDSLQCGNDGVISQNKVISWGSTFFYDYDNDSILNYRYLINKLYYNHDQLVPKPIFSQPEVTATHVTFSAYCPISGTVEMYNLNPKDDNDNLLPNPWTVERADTAYQVILVAYAVYDYDVACFSEDVFFEYEVPAVTVGDVNHDGDIDVNDVTTLIAYILGNDPEDFYTRQANIDGDENGEIDVNDVTALISSILGL